MHVGKERSLVVHTMFLLKVQLRIFSFELSGQIFFDTLNALFSSFMAWPLRFKKATYWTLVFIHSYLHFFLSWSLPVVGMGAPKRIMIRHYEYRKSRIFFKSVTDPKIYEPVSKRRRMKIWDEDKKKKVLQRTYHSLICPLELLLSSNQMRT